MLPQSEPAGVHRSCPHVTRDGSGGGYATCDRPHARRSWRGVDEFPNDGWHAPRAAAKWFQECDRWSGSGEHLDNRKLDAVQSGARWLVASAHVGRGHK